MGGNVYVTDRVVHTQEESIYLDDGTSIHNSHVEIDEVNAGQRVDNIEVLFDITKSKEDEGLVSGWANVSINKDGSLPLDWQDDVIPPETLEKAAMQFMQEYRESGEMHKGESKGIVVESIVFTKEKQEAIGIPEGTVPVGWFITVKINDKEVFDKVKDGTYKMFSIQGKAKRVEL